ncbi:hypothetical protein [Okeania sp. SIO2B3]|uniref:hypothetical protein n=1 Tax=Okeania sp. SIO2B3 TaxID=2607784 RepID=UPI0013C28714|nr:hypothetical protein [Okeania sp. SIO2B3]NET40436.1 hypothetical protein [Okeania sp. SIO2B3]
MACTGGCFQYLPAPWEFEKLLLKTLIESNSKEKWQKSLTNFYQDNQHDDVNLLVLVCSLGKNELDFQYFHSAYQSRLEHLDKNYNIQSKSRRKDATEVKEKIKSSKIRKKIKVEVISNGKKEKTKAILEPYLIPEN